MDNNLYIKLKEAYSEKNLNIISSKIIELYRNKQHAKIKGLLTALGDYINFQDDNINKSFSKLIFMYHPDKGHQYRKEIEEIYRSGNLELLENYTHILLALDIDSVTAKLNDDFDIDYSPEYIIDEDEENEYYFEGSYHQSDDLRTDYNDYVYDNTFFSALKRKYYGNLKVDLPSYYLEDLEEVELTNFDIQDLSGIEYCRQTVYFNLSNNCITDISDIKGLSLIEELYLSDNEIGYIDAVNFLRKLRVIDISNNCIDDISPLFGLPNLEYVNILGNNIPKEQVEILKKENVMVII